MENAKIIFVAAILSGCNGSNSVINCYDAAQSNRKAKFCEIAGVIEQEGADFRIVPSSHNESTPRLVIIHDSTYPPINEQFEIVGKISYCGGYSTHLGDFVLIDVPFNREGTYDGELVVDRCGTIQDRS